MAFDVWRTLTAGGRDAIALLEYSIASVQLEILFGHLIGDYQNQPTAARAIALYDGFCAPNAPGRIHAPSALPPQNLALMQDINQIRDHVRAIEAHNATQPETPRIASFPGRHVFDVVHAVIRSDDNEIISRINRLYDPALGPVENLAGGKRNAAQRMFVERVWRSQLRPLLTQSGFPKLASLGG